MWTIHKRRLLRSALLLSLVPPSVPGGAASALETPSIRVVDNSFDYSYARRMIFQLRLKSDAPLTGLSLHLQAPGAPPLERSLAISAGQTLVVGYRLDRLLVVKADPDARESLVRDTRHELAHFDRQTFNR